MQKMPLSHAQVALLVGLTIILAGPGFYLAVFEKSPWLALVTLVLSQGFLVWKKRRSAAN